MTIAIRPKLNDLIKAEEFKSYYWKKAELVKFCNENGLPMAGGKLELEQIIIDFLNTGSPKKAISKIGKSTQRDSHKTITYNTPVINYKNDSATREFFVKHIGAKFKFNDYLRQFAKQTNLSANITYGELIDGWLEHEANIKSSKQKPPIAKQFQFNQFQRDFYAVEKGKTRQEFLDAWKLVKSLPGPATYAHYLQIVKEPSNEQR